MTFFTHDCFHFTIKGHEELAKGLWNNMVSSCWELMAHGRSKFTNSLTLTLACLFAETQYDLEATMSSFGENVNVTFKKKKKKNASLTI